MENNKCPKCETGYLDANGVCDSCGYAYLVLCPKCAHKNKPNAKYCGSCGEAMNLTVRFQNMLSKHFSYGSRLKAKHFAAGIGFGTVLALFAFGAFN